MAFDGITVAALASELNKTLAGARLAKIAQPEADELMLTIKTTTGQRRLLMSADAALPLLYLTDSNKQAPLTAPNFCMLLRKHLSGARIISVTQPGLERILRFEFEHLDEMGDLCRKYLIIEIMGRHSNIIFCDDKDMIIDSIKHVSAAVSSVREVLPGRNYFIPQTQDKQDLLTATAEEISTIICTKPMPLYKAIYTSYTGLSPLIAQEICYRSGLDGDESATALSAPGSPAANALCEQLLALAQLVRDEEFAPCIAYENKCIRDYAAIPLTSFMSGDNRTESADSISAVLEQFYARKNAQSRIRQKSAELRHHLQTLIERASKKLDLQQAQLKDTEDRDTYRIYGELLHTYGYGAAPGAKSITVPNYYTNEELTIPLDPQLTAQENAAKYFEKYNKKKRTFEALTELTQTVSEELAHLLSVQTSLDIAEKEDDLAQIREELIACGYLKKASGNKKQKITSKPFHYISSDGYDIYVGKNNLQNDELTFRFANGGDWWFHAKKIPGSHVILRVKGTEEVPDRAFEEAARLAAYYSKGRDQEKVEIDYVRRKEVKKPAGARPGFVVYYTNFSMAMPSDISGLEQVE